MPLLNGAISLSMPTHDCISLLETGKVWLIWTTLEAPLDGIFALTLVFRLFLLVTITFFKALLQEFVYF